MKKILVLAASFIIATTTLSLSKESKELIRKADGFYRTVEVVTLPEGTSLVINGSESTTIQQYVNIYKKRGSTIEEMENGGPVLIHDLDLGTLMILDYVDNGNKVATVILNDNSDKAEMKVIDDILYSSYGVRIMERVLEGGR